MAFCDVEGWGPISSRRAMDFTICFQFSVLTILPSTLLLLCFGPRMFKVLAKGRLEGVGYTPWFVCKMSCIFFALALQVAFLAIIVQQREYPSSSILSGTMYIISIVSTGVLHYFEHFNMPSPSGILLLFWLFTGLVSIFPARSMAEESAQGLSDRLPLLKLLFTIFSLVVFVLENIPKPNYASLKRPHTTKPLQDNPSPEQHSNFFARITFLWVLPLLNKGKKKRLRMDDIWSLHPKMLSYPLFLTSQAKIDADEAISRQRAAQHKTTGNVDSAAAVSRKVNLFGVIMHTVGWSFLSAVIPRLLYIPALYVRPVLFSSLISFMASYSEITRQAGLSPRPAWEGYGLAIAVFVTSVFSGIFDAQFNNICFQSSIRSRGAFVSLIYRKALRLSATNKQEGIGAIVNHMSTDVDRVIVLFTVVHYLWSGIIEIAIVAVLLYREIRYAMFASLGVVIVMIGIVGGVAPQIGVCEKRMMKESDKRMKYINELISHIKAIKLHAWERHFVQNITEARSRQLKYLRQFYTWITVVFSIVSIIQTFAIFTALTTYSAIAPPDQPLDIRRIFTTITLINMLQGPLGLVSQALPMFISGKVAYDRLKKFVESEEIDSGNLERHPDANASDIAYEILDGTFGWYTPEAIKSITEQREKEAKDKAKKEAKEKKERKTEQNMEEAEDAKGNLDNKEQKEPKDSKAENEKYEQDLTVSPSDGSGAASDASGDTLGPVLFNVSLAIKRGSLTAIIGRVGDGKSSLVGAMLGEMHKYNGTVRMYGSLAYVAQSAWILGDSVRNNILFGRDYDEKRYLQVVTACALVPDFKTLVDGDKTLIGEKGINLSGGQKQRIAIARAVYADADVYIFDDPLSAVDAHVGRHIFEEVISKLLAHKTRVLVTNGTYHLNDVDQIIVIKNGKISQDGSYEELIRHKGGDLCRLMEESSLTHALIKDVEPAQVSEVEVDDLAAEHGGAAKFTTSDPSTHPTINRCMSSKQDEEKKEYGDANGLQGIDEEVTTEGRVGWNVYMYYIRCVGTYACIAFSFFSLAFIAVELVTQLWLKDWGNDNASSTREHSNTYWMLTYLAWLLSNTIMVAVSIGIAIIVMVRRASKTLHASMLTPMVRSPMSFFDITSSGKIINRFSHDISSVDIELPNNFLGLLFVTTGVTLQFIFAVIATPYFLILLICLLTCYYLLAGYFLVSSRELKRLDSAARSPMYAHFGETLNGLITIRGFGDAERFAMQATKMLDQSQQVYYLTNSTQRWLQMMLSFLSDIVLGFISVMAVVQRNSASAGIFAIVLSQIGTLTELVSMLMTEYCQLETNIISVERIREYSQLPSEAPDVIPDSHLDDHDQWPQQGKIEFQNYSTRYRDGLDLVLKNINLSIQPGERIGIVGRTGAGKTSITLALFRIIEAVEGTIQIDGVDISSLGLNQLRSRLTIIPQDPFLFGGTIRCNLDPFHEWQDADLWAALESASLKSYVSSLPEGLHTAIENGGESMSLGQRQLMSLARAMLKHKHSKVLCLDEATAAIDIETDNAIQRALRESFQDCTVLTIAHRINTIMDSDRILVLDHGHIAEFDTPQTLLENPNGIFYSLAKASETSKSS